MSTKVKRGRSRGTTRLSRKNQVTLPIAALAAAHISQGDVLRVSAKGDGRILLQRSVDPLDEFAGSIPRLAAATQLEKLRDEWAQ
ncbi:MAG: AbrB/MazE/SpoVT family DNA-binding domain-containing protein [Candidatus Dormibacteraceae bacterium]